MNAPKLPTGTRLTLKLDEIKPYWRNPRRISDEAVNALAESIKNYDYQQPIVVDADHVIIVGHTRYTALRRLGVESVDVLVADHLSEKKAAEWRVVDNRTSELTDWNFDALDEELATLDSRIANFFPEMRGLDDDSLADGLETAYEGEVGYGEDDVAEDDGTVELVCPSCFHLWETTVTITDLNNGHIGPLESE